MINNILFIFLHLKTKTISEVYCIINGICLVTSLSRYYNQDDMYFTSNPVYHERNEHVELEYYSFQDIIMKMQMVSSCIKYCDHLGDISMKAIHKRHYFNPYFFNVCLCVCVRVSGLRSNIVSIFLSL